jgi:hypothetical protein
MSKASRDKGRRGQTEFSNLLTSRDWRVDPISCGIMREDIIATDPHGTQWSVEIKNCASILPAHVKQAKEQAKKRGLRWMLANKIQGSRSWLVRRQGFQPVVWTAKED